MMRASSSARKSSAQATSNLPVDAVKIDRSFIRNIAIGWRDAALVRAIITMIADLGLRVIAEGLENQDQLNNTKVR
jgi:EAL domain-containing protein (putative c-di-GMP-specific phosphodiesterase class I)